MLNFLLDLPPGTVFNVFMFLKLGASSNLIVGSLCPQFNLAYIYMYKVQYFKFDWFIVTKLRLQVHVRFAHTSVTSCEVKM